MIEGLHQGDNLSLMRSWPAESVDLVYADPPFCTGKTWEGAAGSFSDRWEGPVPEDAPEIAHLASRVHSPAMGAYLAFMADRLAEVRRLLKTTGSLYVHCDPKANSYLRVLLDSVFGRTAFQAEITWKRTASHNDRVFGCVSDTILHYGVRCETKDESRIPLDPAYVRKSYQSKDLTGPGTTRGESSMPWRGADPGKGGRCWSVPKTGDYAEWIEREVIPGYRSIKGIHDRLDALDAAGLIHWRSTGMPRLKRYLKASKGRFPTNIWDDIPPLSSKNPEKLGYPTQKPLKLLDRIIRASSNEGDLVLDPFCGSGTTLKAAQAAGRRWSGIDLGEDSIRVCADRLGSGPNPPI